MVMAGKGGGRKPLTEEVVRTSDSSRKCMSPQQENLTRPKVTWRASVITLSLTESVHMAGNAPCLAFRKRRPS